MSAVGVEWRSSKKFFLTQLVLLWFTFLIQTTGQWSLTLRSKIPEAKYFSGLSDDIESFILTWMVL